MRGVETPAVAAAGTVAAAAEEDDTAPKGVDDRDAAFERDGEARRTVPGPAIAAAPDPRREPDAEGVSDLGVPAALLAAEDPRPVATELPKADRAWLRLCGGVPPCCWSRILAEAEVGR